MKMVIGAKDANGGLRVKPINNNQMGNFNFGYLIPWIRLIKFYTGVTSFRSGFITRNPFKRIRLVGLDWPIRIRRILHYSELVTEELDLTSQVFTIEVIAPLLTKFGIIRVPLIQKGLYWSLRATLSLGIG